MSFYIGNVLIKNPIIVAPMAGVSDMTFRKICKDFGASLVVGEMVSDKAIVYENEKTFELLKMDERERPISQQIFGSDINSFVKAAKIVEEKMKPDIIDINMGCPAPKVTKNGEGSALLLKPELIDEITKSVVKNSSVPVTIKIRKGWDENHIYAVDIAKIAEKNGISAITVHGRTREQYYSGNADWQIIRKVKESVNIPVIGNGDIVDGKTAKQMFEETNCDAIMIGRASNGNPWIFEEICNYLENGTFFREVSVEDVKKMIIRHLDMLVTYKGEYTAIREMRKQIAWYIKGIPNAAYIRNEINKIEDLAELKKRIENI